MNFGYLTGVWAFLADVLDSVVYQIYQGRGGKGDALENWLRLEWERDAFEKSLQLHLVDTGSYSFNRRLSKMVSNK